MKKTQNNLTKEEKENLNGHRDRLKNRYLTQDNDYMDDSRMLELLLTYSIPRIDVYPHAVALLTRFGDLDNVLNATVDELCMVDGIGPNTALLITLARSLVRKAELSKNKRKKYKKPEDLAEFFCTLFKGIRDERMVVALFNNSFELLAYNWLSKGHPDECIFSKRDVMRTIARDNVSYVAFAHNHPNGNVKPSSTDIDTMFKLKAIVSDMEINLIDMFIVSDDKYFKMNDAASLADRMSEYCDEEFSYTFGNTVTYEAAELTEAVIGEEK